MRLACAALLLVAGIGLNAATPKAEAPKTEAPPVLRKSPEFVIKFVDGKQMLLSSLKGKVVALLDGPHHLPALPAHLAGVHRTL